MRLVAGFLATGFRVVDDFAVERLADDFVVVFALVVVVDWEMVGRSGAANAASANTMAATRRPQALEVLISGILSRSLRDRRWSSGIGHSLWTLFSELEFAIDAEPE